MIKGTSPRIVTMIVCIIVVQGIIPCYAAPPRRTPASSQTRALTLPDARIGQPYEYQFTSSGGRPPFRWEVIDGDLPTGIRLNSNGKLKGTPTVPSTEPVRFIVEVSDSSEPPERSERAVMLMVRPRRLSIEGDNPGLRITGEDEPEPDSDSPRPTGYRHRQPYEQSDRDYYPRQARQVVSHQYPRRRQGEVLSDDDADQAAGDENNQQDASRQIVGQGRHRKARIIGTLKTGSLMIPVAASPHTTVTVYVNDEIAGRTMTDEAGRGIVSIGEPLALGADVKVEEGFGPPASPPAPSHSRPAGGSSDGGNGNTGDNGGTAPPSSLPPPNIDLPVKENAPFITGRAKPKETVTIMVNEKPVASATAEDQGTFKVPVAGLLKGQKITAKQDGSESSIEITVAPPPPPQIVGELHSGDHDFQLKGFPEAKIKVIIDGDEKLPEVTANKDGEVKFTPPLPLRPLAIIKVQQNGGEFLTVTVPDITASADYFNWGRVRAYFYGGAVVSNRNRLSSDTSGNDFTKVDLGVGFTLDKNYIMNRSGTFFVNTFFDTRLTAIPVATKPPASTTPMSVRQASAVHPLADTMTDPFQTFLTSKKAGVAQAGLYLPIAITAWDFGRDPNRLFIAPLGKFGIQTITSEIPTAEGTRLGEDNVYNFFGYGMRLGHYQLKYRNGPAIDTNVGPELVSWLDIIYGRWENFEIRVPKPNLILDPSGQTLVEVRERPWRVGVEGRLKIPALPFMVGFDGNFGQGPDDLRFLFGMRFDIGKVITKLKILEKLGLDK